MSKHEKHEQSPREAAPKKPYLKPSFEREKVFETQALTCGKIQTTQVPAIRIAKIPDRQCHTALHRRGRGVKVVFRGLNFLVDRDAE